MHCEIIKVEEAIGHILCHDITKIVKDEFKGPAYKKGYRIKTEDVPELIKMGKEHVYIIKLEAGEIHEDEAGIRLGRATAGTGVKYVGPREGRVDLVAEISGLLKIDLAALEEINTLPELILTTLPNNKVVKSGDVVAGTKVIPLAVREELVVAAEKIATKGIINVLPFLCMNTGIIITGNEVYSGQITDSFGPVLTDKIISYGSKVFDLAFVPDDAKIISEKIIEMASKGAELLLVCGGMSVDPDDVTCPGIRGSGAEIVKYGAPVLPGAMFLMAYLDSVPVMGLPACVLYYQTTILDLVLPRLMVGEEITCHDIAKLAHGGLCRRCNKCKFPNCSFGMGGSC